MADSINANRDKAEGDRGSVSDSSATRAAERSDVSRNYADENGDNAGGITNRPLDEEVDNQESLPPRGRSREETRNLSEDSGEPEMDREERRSER
jgi:hypothetical protein